MSRCPVLVQAAMEGVPVGGIIMWSGAANAIPTGWALCDGANGTPDLRGRFVLGAGGTYAVGAAGGEENHTLTVAEMPSHEHSFNNRGAVAYARGEPPSLFVMGNPTSTGTTYSIIPTAAGGSQPHNNMPPYYALCYIMKL